MFGWLIFRMNGTSERRPYTFCGLTDRMCEDRRLVRIQLLPPASLPQPADTGWIVPSLADSCNEGTWPKENEWIKTHTFPHDLGKQASKYLFPECLARNGLWWRPSLRPAPVVFQSAETTFGIFRFWSPRSGTGLPRLPKSVLRGHLWRKMALVNSSFFFFLVSCPGCVCDGRGVLGWGVFQPFSCWNAVQIFF